MRLVLFSFLVLFFELALIRYLPAHVKATAYFANLTVIATFLGMGLGLLLARRQRASAVAALFPPILLLLLGAVAFLANRHVVPFSSETEFFSYDLRRHPGRESAQS